MVACCVAAGAPAFAAGPSVPLCFERQEVLPWRTLDGGGLNFELLGEVARRLGIAFDYQSMPWKRCLAQVKANQVSGAFAVSFSRERGALGVYPGTLGHTRGAEDRADPDKRMHVDRYVLVRRKGGRVDWDGRHFANVDGRIGFQLGYSVGDFLRAQNVPVDEGSHRLLRDGARAARGRDRRRAHGTPGAAPVPLRIRRGAPAAAAGGPRNPPRYRGNPMNIAAAGHASHNDKPTIRASRPNSATRTSSSCTARRRRTTSARSASRTASCSSPACSTARNSRP
ncbi:hypothetical protein [Massilia luteola]|uniref:hypothetical protein n=1 Tax=Massilia luteola TaxID=3081751 RepID=UPI002ACBF26F|nr:hypothetical protein [Massilia sp. Gc5]